MLDGKTTAEEQTAIGCRRSSSPRMSERSSQSDPPVVSPLFERPRVVLARPAWLRSACGSEPAQAADAGAARGARLPGDDGRFCRVEARARIARECAAEVVSGAESLVHRRIRPVCAGRIQRPATWTRRSFATSPPGSRDRSLSPSGARPWGRRVRRGGPATSSRGTRWRRGQTLRSPGSACHTAARRTAARRAAAPHRWRRRCR